MIFQTKMVLALCVAALVYWALTINLANIFVYMSKHNPTTTPTQTSVYNVIRQGNLFCCLEIAHLEPAPRRGEPAPYETFAKSLLP